MFWTVRFHFLNLSLFLAPAGPPLEFSVESTGPTILILRWNPPEASLRNGLITSYEYMCADIHTDPLQTTELTATIMGLIPYTNYTCSVRAATVNGTGPAVSITKTTPEDSM